jgi:hypothetical protein
VTNGRWVLEGVDMRSQAGRRFRDLCNAFAGEIGEALTESEKAVVRQCAGMTLQAEAQQSALVRGEPVDGDLIVRMTSEVRRIIAALKGHHHQRNAPSEPASIEELVA